MVQWGKPLRSENWEGEHYTGEADWNIPHNSPSFDFNKWAAKLRRLTSKIVFV